MSANHDTERLTPAIALREFGPSLLLLLACLFVADLALGTDAMYSLLPLARPYYTYDVTRRLHHLERMREQEPVDVLFVGSSVVRADIDPAVFDKVLRRKKLKLNSFNAGLSAMYPQSAKLYLEHLWLDAAEPRYVLHGVRPAELSPASPKRLLRGALDRKWVEGTRWALFQGDFIQRLALAQYRGTAQRMISRFGDDQPMHRTERGELTTDKRGHRKEARSLDANRKRHSKRLWKYRSSLAPTRYRKAFPVLEQMRDLCAAAGAQYVLVNMPEHPDRYPRKNGAAIWAEYLKRVRSWAKANDVPFLDVSEGDLQAFNHDEYYSDFHHMSQRGAEHFSTKLAEQFAKLVKKKQKK